MKVKLVTLDGCERFLEMENPVRVIEVPINFVFPSGVAITEAVRRYEYHHTDREVVEEHWPRAVDPNDIYTRITEGLPVYIEAHPHIVVREPRVETSEPVVVNKRQLREGE